MTRARGRHASSLLHENKPLSVSQVAATFPGRGSEGHRRAPRPRPALRVTHMPAGLGLPAEEGPSLLPPRLRAAPALLLLGVEQAFQGHFASGLLRGAREGRSLGLGD